ncbi:MAG: carbohydrate kinase family protein [Spirochaetia bacterium]
MGFDAAVIGNAGIDTNVYLYGNEIDFSVEANFSRNIDYIGQAGGYSARGFASLGLRTAFIGALGKDWQGKWIRETFEKEGIDLSAVFSDPAGTARSINFMYPDGRRKNFYDGKSHMEIHPDLSASKHVLNSAQLAVFHIPNWARELLPYAKEHCSIVAVDLQDIVSVDDEYRRDFIDSADILFFSAANHNSPEPIIRKVWEKAPEKLLVAGMGSRGVCLGVSGEITYFPAVESDFPIIDTNGAGDSLAAGFLYGFVFGGYSQRESILLGQIAARHACTLQADTENLISQEELISRFHVLNQRV